MISGFLIAGAIVLEVLAEIPCEWYFCGASIAFTIAHTVVAEPFSRAGPFWMYVYRRFGFGRVHFLLGFALFLGLAAVLIRLAVWGYVRNSPFARGALNGAKLADALLSHVGLRARFEGRNPGLKTSLLYLIESPLSLWLFPASLLGFLVGSGAFALFWIVAFVIRKFTVAK